MKGSAITSRIRFIRERADEATYREVRASLEPEHRAILEAGVLPHAWVPYSLFVALNVAVDARLGAGDLALCRDMGRYAAEVNLPTLYRLFLRLGSVGFILRKASRLWSVHYDSGALVVEELGDRACCMTVERFAEPHKAHCLSLLGWCEGAIVLTGATVVEAREETCRLDGAPSCRFYAKWR